MKLSNFFIGIVLQISCQQAYSCTLTLAVSSEFSPHLILHSNDSWSGASIDLAKTLVNKADCKLNIIYAPWARAIKLLEQGEIDLLTNLTINKNRSKFINFVGPHYLESASFIVRKDVSTSVQSLTQLGDFNGKIGVQRGTDYGLEFRQHILLNPLVNEKITLQTGVENQYPMLKYRRIDALFVDKLIAKDAINTNKLDKEQFEVRFTLKGNPVYFAFSKKTVSDELIHKLEEAWLNMKEQKIVEIVNTKYGLETDI